MDHSDRRARIRANLGIEPIIHGQVYTLQLAIPDSAKQNINPEKIQLLKDSLNEHKTNLVPLIVRQTQIYSEDQEYEVVYGYDWYIVAKELNIEKLWVWVFDLTDEQAEAARLEMERLVREEELQQDGGSNKKLEEIQKLINIQIEHINQLKNQLNQKVNQNEEIMEFKEIQESFSAIEQRLQKNIDFKIQHGLERLENSIRSQIDQLDAKLNQIIDHFQSKQYLQKEDIQKKQSKISKKSSQTSKSEDDTKINLLTATKEQIEQVIKRQPEAAYEAIELWRNRGKLTWTNLKKSTQKGEDKVENFGDQTYKKLREVGDITS